MGMQGYRGAPRWPGVAAAEKTATANDLAYINTDGNYTPGAVATDLVPVGIFACNFTSVGKAAGTVRVEVWIGSEAHLFRVTNGTDADKLTKIGAKAYCTGKRSVGLDSTGRSFAGYVAGFEDTAKTIVLLYVPPFVTF